MRRLFTQFLLMSIFLAGFIGCLNDIEEVPLDTSDGAVTAAPTGIKIQVGDGSIHISWNAVSNAATYRLYRRWGAESGISLISDSPNTFYLDEDVINGQAYYYSIAGVNSQKLEGRRSGMIYAVPSIYNLLINGGDAYTGSRTVLLNLTAPLTTTLMRIANDSLMGGDSWELFGINREWNLDEGDGIKRVYAVFQDENGSLSPVSSNSIILDTYASIEDISFTPAPYLYSPGATVHFVLRVEDDET
ncbi:MAG: fibronectin type III domain-containing protein, partial [Candidatus Krumholzibacteriota bacterium]|nr:fibronectin type III domain-containing protein [Candidatus Krumholzibacteriota bacterium]